MEDRARGKGHLSWLPMQCSPYTALRSMKKPVTSRTGRGWPIQMLFSVSCLLGVVHADFYFMGVLETWWWGSVSLPLGRCIVTMSSSCKGSRYREPEICLVYCDGCRQEESWCGFWTDTGCSLSSMKWKRGKLMDYRHMQASSQPGHRLVWYVRAYKMGRNTHVGTSSADPWTFTRMSSHGLLPRDTVSGHQYFLEMGLLLLSLSHSVMSNSFATPWNCSLPGSSVHGISQQE